MAQTEATVIELNNTAYIGIKFLPGAKSVTRHLHKYAGTVNKGRDGRTYRLINDLDVKPFGSVMSEDIVKESVDLPSPAQARSPSFGWKPLDEFHGDPARWRDAEAFS